MSQSIEIDEALFGVVEDVAHQNDVPVSRVVSFLIGRALGGVAFTNLHFRNGVPLLPQGDRFLSPDEVQELIDLE